MPIDAPLRLLKEVSELLIVRLDEPAIAGVARLHRLAFAGYLNTRLGMPYLLAFIRWFCEAEDGIALVAVDQGGQPAGYVVGAPLGYTKRLNLEILRPALRGMLLHPWLLFDSRFRQAAWRRFRSFAGAEPASNQEMHPALPLPTVSLVGIGVHPDWRGRQIGARLLVAFEENARQLSSRSMRLSVYPENIPACKLYEKAGWQAGDIPQPGGAITYHKLLT